MQKSMFFVVVVSFFSLNVFAKESTGTFEMALTPTWPVEGKYFGFLENKAGKKQGTGKKALFYSKSKYGDLNSFLAKCLKKCAKGKKGNCGGVVVRYHTSEKKTPKKCLFKERGASIKSNKKQVKDYFQEVCYEGGLYTANCKHLNLGACWDKSIAETKISDSPWRVGEARSKPELEDCRRTCAAWDTCYGPYWYTKKKANFTCTYLGEEVTRGDNDAVDDVDWWRHSMCK